MLCWATIYATLILLSESYTTAHPIDYALAHRATLDTGSCVDVSPEIEFANGLDGRTETAFAPVDSKNFNHGSADSIAVIADFICQQLSDKCKASQDTLDTCSQAQAAAAKVTGGAAADAFNAVFRIQTQFTNSANDVIVSSSTTPAAAAAASTSGPCSSTAISAFDFGSCTNPAIEFGPGFDGRKAIEFTFEPEDRTSIDHGSVQNIDTLIQATCDQLKTKCNAPASTLAACSHGQKVANAQTTGGAQADAFNEALGIITNFAATPAALGGGVATPKQAAEARKPGFGTCSTPVITFGIFDGRTEDSFEPSDLKSFNHSSALNIDIITQFICDSLVNTCNANQAAVNSCAAAKTAVNGLTGQAAADAFNKSILQPVSSA